MPLSYLISFCFWNTVGTKQREKEYFLTTDIVYQCIYKINKIFNTAIFVGVAA